MRIYRENQGLCLGFNNNSLEERGVKALGFRAKDALFSLWYLLPGRQRNVYSLGGELLRNALMMSAS